MKVIRVGLGLDPLGPLLRPGAMIVGDVGGDPTQIGTGILDGGIAGIVQYAQVGSCTIPRFVSADTLARERLQLPGMGFIREMKFADRAIRYREIWDMPSAAPMARRSAKGPEVDRPEFNQAVSGSRAAYCRSWRKLGAGGTAQYDCRTVSHARPVDAMAALAWTREHLVFAAAPPADVVTALNRYRRTPIELADSS